MTTKLILINTDTHAVVPREPTVEMLQAAWGNVANLGDLAVQYRSMTAKAPPLTTPPVLRWEGSSLMVGFLEVAHISPVYSRWKPHILLKTPLPIPSTETEQEARRAAEKALGLPEIEEV